MVCWSVIVRLFESLIGRAIFVLWLALPIFNISSFVNINTYNYRISLIGASIIAVTYIVVKIVSPEIIKQYKTNKEYVDYLLLNSNSIIITDEFKSVTSCSLEEAPDALKEHLPMSNHVTVLGPLKSIRVYGKYNYIITDNTNAITRCIIMILFIIGMLFLLFPSFNAIIQLLRGPS